MLISLEFLCNKYNIVLNGIVHVGAHECEEIQVYEKYLPRDKILWVEAMPDKVEICKNKYPGLLIENAVISDVVETVKFNVSNNGQSSSMLELGVHKIHHSEVHYVDSFEVQTQTLGNILDTRDFSFNFINLDIQGVEMKALMGMEKYLSIIPYIYCEVNSNYVYEGCSLLNEIDVYLESFGFKRVELVWYQNCEWGDAFYIRS
jgi:FkbM family methyltransferase